MDRTLFSVKGCYYLVSGTPGGYWAVSQSISAACPVLLMDANITGRDMVAKTVCFNNTRVAAVTSKDFGNIMVSGIALLGPVTSSATFEGSFQSWWNGARVSNGGGTAMVSSLGGGAHRFLLETSTIGKVDDQYNIQHFSFGGSLLD